MLRTVLATIGALTVAGIASAAVALPLTTSAPKVGTQIEQVHGCHPSLLRDRRGVGIYGWHYHDRACVRHDAPPPGYADAPSRRNVEHYWHVPVCRYQCGFVGPVKRCVQVRR